MEERKDRVGSSILRAFWSVFGYFFVGFISLFYGISLQYFNMNGKFKQMLLLASSRNAYIVFIFTIILYNLLFCHAYASLYIKETDNDKILYPKLGHWLETILLIVIASYFNPILFSHPNWVNILLIMVSISFPWCTTIVFYRTFLAYCKSRAFTRTMRIKHKLINPCFMLIAVNIYTGASICEMWNRQIPYFIVFGTFSLFLFAYCLIEFIHYKKTKNGNSASSLDHKFPYFYYSLLLAFALICIYFHHYQNNNLFYIPMRTLFLADFVSIYLSMFEGWFIMRNETNTSLAHSVHEVMTYMPMVVFILFPFQQFQLIFFICFILGHCSAWLYRYYYVNAQAPSSSYMAFMRGLLGTLTLASLIADKWIPLNVSEIITSVIHLDNIMNINTLTAIISIAASLGSIATIHLRKKSDNILRENKRVLIYVAIICVLWLMFPHIKDIEYSRLFLSIIGCSIFICFELFMKYSIEKNDEETEKIEEES